MRKILILILLASCSLQPNYERPYVDSPLVWRDSLPTADAVDIGWWKQFGDPVLDDLINQSIENNQDLKVAIARVDQFRADLNIARSKLYPQINLEPSASRQQIASSVTALPFGIQKVFNVFSYLFSATYLVDFWGEVRSAVDAAYHQWLGSIEERRTVVLTLISSVANTYIQLRSFDAQYEISKLTLRDRLWSEYLAQVRFDLGLTSQMQVEQAISEVEIAAIRMEQLKNSIAEAENLLSVLIGQPSMTIPRGKSLDDQFLPFSVPEVSPICILDQRPDIRAAEETLQAAGANIGVARSKFFPQINLNSSIGADSLQLSQLFSSSSRVWDIGTQILQEVFTGGNLIGHLRLSEAEQKEALHQYLSTVLKAFQDVNDAMTAHTINLRVVEEEQVRVTSLGKYLDLSLLRYNEGESDYLTYLDAERHLFSAKLDYEESKANCFFSYIKIYEAIGGGWVLSADEQAICLPENDLLHQ